ncbi:MAG: phosphotransferase family protein [Promethearchaeota archaeon]
MIDSFEEKNPADIEVDSFFPYIKKIFHDINKAQIQFYYHGTYNIFNITYQNEPYILRIPDRAFRNSEGVELIKREIFLLSHFQSHFSSRIPQPFQYSLNPEIPFMINRKIPGISLSRVFKILDPQKIQRIGKSVGQFLAELHSDSSLKLYFEAFPQAKKEMVHFGLNYRKYWADFYHKTQKKLYPLFSKDQQGWLNKVFSKFLDNQDNFHFTPTLSHGDFDTSNILVDPDKGILTGIIDFEDCKLYDPAADLLFFNEGSEFLENILRSRSKKEDTQDETLKNRMQFLFSRTCLAYIMWGVENDRPEMVSAGFRIMQNNRRIFPMD